MNFSATSPSNIPVSTPAEASAPAVETVVETPAAQAAPVVPAPKQEVAVASQENNSGIEGEVTSGDIRPPRISLIQKISELSEQFDTGTFVFDKSVQLNPEATHPLAVTFLRFKKYYQEKLPFGGDAIPLRFDTIQEVRANGGSTTYGDANYYSEAADILLAIEKPEKIDEEAEAFFPYFCEGKHYGMALYTINSSAFTALGKKIITDATMLLKDGLWTGEYQLSAIRKTSPKGGYHVPAARFSRKHSETACQFFKLMSGR